MTKWRDTVQRAMTRGAGVVRSAESLAGARAVVDDATSALGDATASVAAGELANLLRVADALLASALARTESRGAHARAEYPAADPAWRRRLVHGRRRRRGRAAPWVRTRETYARGGRARPSAAPWRRTWVPRAT